MSAYVVSTTHIDAILSVALAAHESRQPGTYHPDAPDDGRRIGTAFPLDHLTVDTWGDTLLVENFRSVMYRYPDDGLDAPGHIVTVEDLASGKMYRHRPVWVPTSENLRVLGMALQACRSLAYQSCEHPEWELSLAKSMLDSIVDCLTARIIDATSPDGMGWSLDERDVYRKAVAA